MRRCLMILAAGLLAFHPGFVTAWTQVPGLLPDRVEEDWELVIGDPDTALKGPQMTTTMSPLGDNKVNFVTFNINYREDNFRPGGLELQAWAGRRLIVKEADREPILATPGERITWTQAMSVANNEITYAIANGRSETYGEFGQANNLVLSYAAALSDLSRYRPDVSVANSGVGWQSNRVTSMKLLRVRYFSGDTLLSTDEAVREINLDH